MKGITKESYIYAEENDIEIIKMTRKAYDEIVELSKATTCDKFAKKNERTKKW